MYISVNKVREVALTIGSLIRYFFLCEFVYFGQNLYLHFCSRCKN